MFSVFNRTSSVSKTGPLSITVVSHRANKFLASWIQTAACAGCNLDCSLFERYVTTCKSDEMLFSSCISSKCLIDKALVIALLSCVNFPLLYPVIAQFSVSFLGIQNTVCPDISLFRYHFPLLSRLLLECD